MGAPTAGDVVRYNDIQYKEGLLGEEQRKGNGSINNYIILPTDLLGSRVLNPLSGHN
jgi:hypothetical protein